MKRYFGLIVVAALAVAIIGCQSSDSSSQGKDNPTATNSTGSTSDTSGGTTSTPAGGGTTTQAPPTDTKAGGKKAAGNVGSAGTPTPISGKADVQAGTKGQN